MNHKLAKTFVISVFLAGLGLGIILSSNPAFNPLTKVAAQTSKSEDMKISPVLPTMNRDVFYPGTEALAPDEMRVTALGTGMPWPRPAQAGPCFLVELGNGDKFLFDLGEGCVENLVALQIPWPYLDKLFIGHLHGDHFGDLGALFISGGLGGRYSPLRVWGPSGPTPELGTAYAVDHIEKAFTWDRASRAGYVDVRGFRFETHEFDYKNVNEPIFQENDVTIRSIPAIHALDGPVSFILEWNGMKFVFSSDTAPNKWFDKYASDADLVVHESFITARDVWKKLKADPASALFAGTQAHTAPEAFGKIMSRLKPRRAVAYHFFKDHDTTVAILDAIRQTYNGPLSLAEDFMVWNVTKDNIRERVAIVNEHSWNPPKPIPGKAPTVADRDEFAAAIGVKTSDLEFSPETLKNRLDVDDVVQPIYEALGKEVGMKFNFPDPR